MKILKQFKKTKRQIYCLDETWINARHIKNFVFDKILTIFFPNAFSNRLSMELKNSFQNKINKCLVIINIHILKTILLIIVYEIYRF